MLVVIWKNDHEKDSIHPETAYSPTGNLKAGRRSCHLPRVGGRRKCPDGADDARRRDKLEEGDHIYVYVYVSVSSCNFGIRGGGICR